MLYLYIPAVYYLRPTSWVVTLSRFCYRKSNTIQQKSKFWPWRVIIFQVEGLRWNSNCYYYCCYYYYYYYYCYCYYYRLQVHILPMSTLLIAAASHVRLTCGVFTATRGQEDFRCWRALSDVWKLHVCQFIFLTCDVYKRWMMKINKIDWVKFFVSCIKMLKRLVNRKRVGFILCYW